MQIFIRAPRGGTITVEVEGTDCVESLRAKIHAKATSVGERGFAPARQRLFFTDELGDAHELRDGNPLSKYNIRKEAELTLGMRPKPRSVSLNVGGRRQVTLLSTLTAVRGSKLCETFRPLAEGGAAVEIQEGVPFDAAEEIDLPLDAEGAFVIDRDARSFDFILNYLRDLAEVGAGDQSAPEPEPEDTSQTAATDEPHLVQLRAELGELKLSTLKRRAAAVGVDSAVLFEADDAEDVRGTVVDLIIATVGPKEILLPDTREDLQRLVKEAQHFGLPELAAACRQKLQRDRQATETDRQHLRWLLNDACRQGMPDAQRAAAVSTVERLCCGEFSLRRLREQQQRMADRQLMEELVRRAAFAVELQEKWGLTAKAADALTTDWSGMYTTHKGVHAITDAEAQRLGLDVADVVAARAVPTYYCTFGFVQNVGSISSFDTNGVLCYLGTERGTRPWVNPHDSGQVVASRSSGGGGQQSWFVCGPGPEFSHYCAKTSTSQNSWMSVDLGATRKLVVEHYCLRHPKDQEYELRNWELQGSLSANGPWTTLRKHDNDRALCKGTRTCVAWEVEGAAPFQVFRIFQCGINKWGDYSLCCGGIELYGALTEEEL